MSTKRTIINSFRDKLRETSADSDYSNQFLYQSLLEQAKWLIKREIAAGRIYINNSLFQVLKCQPVIETSTIDPCCPVKTNCKIYRTKNKLPEMWIDNDGPVIRSVTSVDYTTDFYVTNPITWQAKRNDPYQKMIDAKYVFFAENYLWFPEHNPNFVNITGYYTDDISEVSVDACNPECTPSKECVRFLDTKFQMPDWLEAEMMSKALMQMAGVTRRFQEDEDINKNSTRR